MFAGLLVASAIFAQLSIGSFPETVAIHFDATGAADGWTTKDRYRLSLTMVLLGLPPLLVWLMAGLPRLTQGKGQIPDSEYWFAPERRVATQAFLLQHASWLGCLTSAFLIGAHILIARANAIAPPALALDRFVMTVLVFFMGLGWWLMALLRHFQRPGR